MDPDWLDASRLTLKSLFLPPAGLLLLLLCGLLLYRRAFGKLFAWSSLLSLYLLATPWMTDWLARHVETIPAIAPAELAQQQVQAILVLGSGQTQANPELGGRSQLDDLSLQRLDYALRLHRQTGLPLIISAGTLSDHAQPVAELAAQWLREQAGVEPLALEGRSHSTWKNLEYTAPILEQLGIRKVALVTHAFHMPRAMFSARQHGVDALAAPCSFLYRPGKSWSDWLPSAKAFRHNYLLLHEWAGITWYRLRAPD